MSEVKGKAPDSVPAPKSVRAGLGPASRAPTRVGPFRGTLPPEDAPRVLDIARVSKRFGERTILDDVSFHVPVGEFLCLCGPNGAGKSTLLKIILGLIPTDKGEIKIAGLPAE